MSICFGITSQLIEISLCCLPYRGAGYWTTFGIIRFSILSLDQSREINFAERKRRTSLSGCFCALVFSTSHVLKKYSEAHNKPSFSVEAVHVLMA